MKQFFVPNIVPGKFVLVYLHCVRFLRGARPNNIVPKFPRFTGGPLVTERPNVSDGLCFKAYVFFCRQPNRLTPSTVIRHKTVHRGCSDPTDDKIREFRHRYARMIVPCIGSSRPNQPHGTTHSYTAGRDPPLLPSHNVGVKNSWWRH